nr:nicotinate phosphoribosyltransferase [Pseudomonadota bacterium]
LLDDAGFNDTRIFASGDIDEYQIQKLKANHAAVNAWGIGTRLVTCYDQPALNTIYKLSAIRNANNAWDYKLKISDQPQKTTMAGIHQIRRYYKQSLFVGDVIYDIEMGIDDGFLTGADQYEDLLVPIFKQGKLVYAQPSIESMRDYALTQMRHFMQSDHQNYPVTLEEQLQNLQRKLGAKV